MVEASERALSLLRRINTFIGVAGTCLPFFVLALLWLTKYIFEVSVNAGNSIALYFEKNNMAMLVVCAGIGYIVAKNRSINDAESSIPLRLITYFVIGIIAICIIFWFLPALLDALSQVVAELLSVVAQVCIGPGKYTVKMLIKLVLSFHIVAFALSAAIASSAANASYDQVIVVLIKKCKSEIAECLRDILDAIKHLIHALVPKQNF